MKRILVTDDERPIVESIAHIIKRDLCDEFEVVATAHSGRDAIDKAAICQPDIILMDVRMPGISGLDAIREIRKRGSDATFILITAYERFDIAREALELGVIDYLLKPVGKDQLTQALRHGAEYLDKRLEQASDQVAHQEMLSRQQYLTELALVQSLLLDCPTDPELLIQWKISLGIKENYAIVLALTFLPSRGSPDPLAEVSSLHGSLRDLLKYKTQVLIGPLSHNHSLIIVPLRDKDNEPGRAEELGELIGRHFPQQLRNGNLAWALGDRVAFTDLHFSWRSAWSRLVNRSQNHQALEKALELDEEVLTGLLDQNPELARIQFQKLLSQIRSAQDFDITLLGRMISLFGTVYRRLVQRGVLSEALGQQLFDFSDIMVTTESQALASLCSRRFDHAVELMVNSPRGSPLVVRTLAWMRSNYTRQITLEQAADDVLISPNRLSKLLTEETGKGFSDLLIEMRLEKAKDLLRQAGAAVKQVSVACGYLDPNYFARLFKKVTGLTPSAYAAGFHATNSLEDASND